MLLCDCSGEAFDVTIEYTSSNIPELEYITVYDFIIIKILMITVLDDSEFTSQLLTTSNPLAQSRVSSLNLNNCPKTSSVLALSAPWYMTFVSNTLVPLTALAVSLAKSASTYMSSV